MQIKYQIKLEMKSKFPNTNQRDAPSNDRKTTNSHTEAEVSTNDSRFIDTVKYGEARAREMKYFEEYVNKKHAGTRVVTQTLPKHMRRRAMSHNRILVPSRIRKIAKSGFTKTVKHPKRYNPRKTARKRLMRARTDMLELFAYKHRHQDNVVLETHKFHAKRMKMTSRGKFRVAKKGFVKQLKTAYKWSLTNSFVMDKSFYNLKRLTFSSTDGAEKVCSFLTIFQNYAYIIFKEKSSIVIAIDPLLENDF